MPLSPHGIKHDCSLRSHKRAKPEMTAVPQAKRASYRLIENYPYCKTTVDGWRGPKTPHSDEMTLDTCYVIFAGIQYFQRRERR